MEENTGRKTTQTERRSLALAALIIALVAALCALVVGWRIFAIAIAGASFVLSIFVLTKVKHKGPSKSMSLLALVVSLVAAALAWYNLSQIKEDLKGEEIPVELRDSTRSAPDEGTLDRLKNSMDTAQSQD